VPARRTQPLPPCHPPIIAIWPSNQRSQEPGARNMGAHHGRKDARPGVGGGHARDCCRTSAGTGGAGAGPRSGNTGGPKLSSQTTLHTPSCSPPARKRRPMCYPCLSSLRSDTWDTLSNRMNKLCIRTRAATAGAGLEWHGDPLRGATRALPPPPADFLPFLPFCLRFAHTPPHQSLAYPLAPAFLAYFAFLARFAHIPLTVRLLAKRHPRPFLAPRPRPLAPTVAGARRGGRNKRAEGVDDGRGLGAGTDGYAAGC
jgi:hypothetical protein